MKFKISRQYGYGPHIISDIEGDDHDQTTVYFDMLDYKYVHLRNVKKQFPNIDTIVIGKNISSIEISNFMFPNVKRVISHSKYFVSDSTCLIEVQYNGDKVLNNTFCKGKNEVIDMDGISGIEPYAFEGCMSTNLINVNQNAKLLNPYKENTLHGSMFLLKESQKNIRLFQNVLTGINVPDVIVPHNITDVYTDMDFYCAKVIRMDNIDIFTKIAIRLSDYKSKHIDYHCDAVLDIKGRVPVNELCNLLTNTAFDSISISTDEYLTVDGILYSKDKRILMRYPVGKRCDEIIIPEGTEHIMDEAFMSCNVKSVVIPDSVKHIDSYAFYESQLEHVTFGKGLSYISEWAFASTKLEEVEIPGNVKMICESAFSDTPLKKVILHEGVESILKDAFYGQNINCLEIPSSLKYLGKQAFCVSRPDTGKLTIRIKETLPQNFISAFVSLYVSKETEKRNQGNIKICFDNGKQIVIPGIMRNIDADTMNKEFNAGIIEYKCYYDKAVLTETKQDMVFDYLYEGHQDDKEIITYLRRTAKNIAKRYIKSKDSQRLIKFVELGFLTGKSLNSILKLANEAGMTTAAAYILRKLEDMSKSTFRL